jgi:hypothetical protein
MVVGRHGEFPIPGDIRIGASLAISIRNIMRNPTLERCCKEKTNLVYREHVCPVLIIIQIGSRSVK